MTLARITIAFALLLSSFSSEAVSLEVYLEWRNTRGTDSHAAQSKMFGLEAGMGAALDYLRDLNGALDTHRLRICAPQSVRFTPSLVAAALEMQFETFKASGGFTPERRGQDMIVHTTRGLALMFPCSTEDGSPTKGTDS